IKYKLLSGHDVVWISSSVWFVPGDDEDYFFIFWQLLCQPGHRGRILLFHHRIRLVLTFALLSGVYDFVQTRQTAWYFKFHSLTSNAFSASSRERNTVFPNSLHDVKSSIAFGFSNGNALVQNPRVPISVMRCGDDTYHSPSNS